MILFDNEWALRRSMEEDRTLTYHDVQPRKAAAATR